MSFLVKTKTSPTLILCLVVRRGVAIGFAVLGILIAGAVVIGIDGRPTLGGAKPVITVSGLAVSDNRQNQQEASASQLGPSGLSHASPPPPEVLRDYSHAQSVYDQEAKPGDFVTPPAVSVEH